MGKLYLDCLCLELDDYNRVQLTTGNGDPGCDYINASFIDVCTSLFIPKEMTLPCTQVNMYVFKMTLSLNTCVFSAGL